ncbi:DUF1828 domain-containing protein [Lentilactobacillus kisonensis]|uniref:DUF1828 domain-containing protein n=2 Tax=Lentilactobacillus kisonensis TaxID=481722 RepID=H1LCB7_9LACO|nr:DUF1828 domain-containing protein [Lentilactobacillus kisonensis]EHO54134.1 hypothetical protein HMPREF9104_00230 [Lentilactobacillus kisonensis F0435]KRL22668.1 hypothetical protein FC98_GL002268 [Lentilactobacillus kisonensis DSM 19906 = JCM 15041]
MINPLNNVFNKLKVNSVKSTYHFEMPDNAKIIIVTPFVDPFGDGITLSMIEKEGAFTVSDDGYTLWNLRTRIINGDNEAKYNRLLAAIGNHNQVNLTSHIGLSKSGGEDEIPQLINTVTQTIIEINTMAYWLNSQ